ncbi:glycoprotein precursor [Kismaayo virus]|uniref:Glycoprotein n=1 Tax=Kismaayo virus TaxID=2847813 RepID=A0A097SRW1_9VIRU|nr:glycoprotein precursor [Kismaayo virus]AIU95034.1 glycoprotein precursor [Kismaayo virus]
MNRTMWSVAFCLIVLTQLAFQQESLPCKWGWYSTGGKEPFVKNTVNISMSYDLSTSEKICLVSMGAHWRPIISQLSGVEIESLDELIPGTYNWPGTKYTRLFRSFSYDILDGMFFGYLHPTEYSPRDHAQKLPIHPECERSKICAFMSAWGPIVITCALHGKGIGRTGYCNSRSIAMSERNVKIVGIQHSQPTASISVADANFIKDQRRSDNPTFCDVDGEVINPCEHKMPGRWYQMHYASFPTEDGVVVYLAAGMNIVWSQSNVDESDFFCQNNSHTGLDHLNPCAANCSKNECHGDDWFCNIVGCGSSKPCQCHLLNTRGFARVRIGSKWLSPNVVGVQKMFVREEYIPNYHESGECTTCSLQCSDDGIEFLSIKDSIKDITVCIEGFCSMKHKPEGKNWKIPFGSQYPRAGAVAQASGQTEAGEHFNLQASCGDRSGCGQINCVFCRDMISNPQCYPYGKWLLLALIVGVLYLCIAVTKTFLGIVYKAFIIAYVPIKMLLKIARCVSRIGKRKGVKTYDRLIKAIENEGGETTIEIRKDTRDSPNPKRAARKPRIVLFIVAILCLTSPVSTCDETKIVEETDVVCTHSGGQTYSCTTKSVITLEELRAGHTVCISLKGPGGSMSEPIRIRMDDIVGRADLLDAYYTFNGQANCRSVRRCRWAGSCSAGCISITSADYDSELGNPESHAHPNWLDCYDGCGGAACGCFNVAPSCIFLQRYVTNKDSKVFKVFSASAWFLNTKVSVTMSRKTDNIIIKSGEMKVLDKVNFHYETDRSLFAGITIPPIVMEVKPTGKPNNFFLDSQGLHPKCKDESSARMASASNCIVDQAAIVANPRVDDVACRSNLVSISGMNAVKPLPQRMGDFLIDIRNDEPVLLAVGTSSAVEGKLTVDLSHKKVDIIVDGNICRGTFVTMTGCIACTKGASVSLKIHAEKGGEASLQCQDSSCRIRLEAGVNIVNCSLRFSRAQVSENCILACSGSKEDILLSGALLIGGDFKKLTDDSVSNFEHTSSKSGMHIESGLLNWLTTLFGSSLIGKILGILMVIVSPFLIFLIIKLVIRLIPRQRPRILSKTY